MTSYRHHLRSLCTDEAAGTNVVQQRFDFDIDRDRPPRLASPRAINLPRK